MKEVFLDQGTPEWFEFRRIHIGASDSSIIMGKNPWKKPLQLWEEKMLGTKSYTSAAMERGTKLEGMVRDWFCENHIEVRPAVFTHSEYEWLSASVDGISDMRTKLIEIKCPGEKSFEEFKNGKVPEHYLIQMQHQMLVTGCKECLLLVSDGTLPPLSFLLDADPDMQDQILQACKAFHESMLDFTPPNPLESEIAVRDDEEWEEAAKAWLRANEALKEAKELEAICRESLRYLAGTESAQGCGVSVKKTFCKGTVDYSKIPELKGIDLDKYRKPPIEKWTLLPV